MSPNAPCPCFSGNKYKRCCRPLHNGEAPSEPVFLMRSRYSAFSMGYVDYIIKSTHRDGSQYSVDTEKWRASITRFCKDHNFTGLTIEAIDTSEEIGYVQFTANLKHGSHDRSFRERSMFRRCEAGVWKYLGASS